MAMDVFQAPGRIIFGWNSVEKVGEEALKFGSRAMIVTGRNSSRVNGSLDAVLTSLQAAGVAATLFCEVDSDPCVQAITDGAARARECGADVIIALGGGSPLDVGKAEGVEDQAQATWLHQHGCEEAQGYLYAPALDNGTLQARLQAQQAEPLDG